MDNGVDLYERQRRLGLILPDSVAIIGVGGVGAWVALDLALTGVPELMLIDDDIVEKHNLNRTPFRIQDISTNKVTSMAEIIFEHREETKVLPIAKKIEDLNEYEIKTYNNYQFVVDCRDNTDPLPKGSKPKSLITGGYDGFKVTIHVNPKEGSVWGDGPTRYSITPSWLVPPQFIAMMVTLYLSNPSMQKSKETTYTFDIRDMLSFLQLTNPIKGGKDE